MGGMLRDLRARTLSWTVLRVPLRAPDPVKASSFHAGVNAAAGNPHADMMKRFYPDTAAGGTDLEAILKSTPTRQQSHNPQTGVRIGEASHPGPICFPLDMARPGRRCRNIWCQVPLASQGPLECCPLCSDWPLCHRCVCQAVALGQCGCRATGQPVRVDQRRDAISTPGGPSSNMDTDCPPEVSCVIPGCNDQKVHLHAAGPSVAFCREVPIHIMIRTHHAHRLRMVVHAMLPADFSPDFGDLATCLYSEILLPR